MVGLNSKAVPENEEKKTPEKKGISRKNEKNEKPDISKENI